MDLVQPFSGFPDANWYDCGRRSASPAVPPPRGPLTKSGSTGAPRRHDAVAADTAAIFICRLREGLGSTRLTLTLFPQPMVVGAWRRSVSQLAGGFHPSAHPRRHSPRQGCERSDETPARAGLAPEARGDVFVTSSQTI